MKGEIMKKERIMLKLFINQFYQNIWVEVKQHNKTVVCKYCYDITLPNISRTDWSFVLGKIKGISVCKEDDKFDFILGKRIAIKSFIIKAYGNIKAHNIAKFQSLTKKFQHERRLQTQLQDNVRVSLGEIETNKDKPLDDLDIEDENLERLWEDSKGIKQTTEEACLELDGIGYQYKPCSRCGNIPVLKHNEKIKDMLYHLVCNCGRSVTDAPSVVKAIQTWNIMN